MDPADDPRATDATMVENGLLTVHPPSACAGQGWGCWVHAPVEHALSSAPVRWRDDRAIAERICEHGIGHPDPQGAAYSWQVEGRDVTSHGCDGCCGGLPESLAAWLPA